MFYSAEREQLHANVQTYLAAIEVSAANQAPKAIIAPHAGYIYSGPVAASAYAQLLSVRDRIHRVILLGPSHRVAIKGLATSSADSFTTPLGSIRLDQAAINSLANLSQVHCLDKAHALEHSLEVPLTFLQETLDDFQLVPLVVG